jgi:hypothetical protein
VDEASDQELGRFGQLAGVGIDDGEHGDDLFLGECAPVLH